MQLMDIWEKQICSGEACSRNVYISELFGNVCSVFNIMNIKCSAISLYFILLNWVPSPIPEGFELGIFLSIQKKAYHLKVASLQMLAYVQWEQNFDETGERERERESNLLNVIVFPFLHYFHEMHESWGPAQRLNAVKVILSVLPWALHRC